MQMDNATQPAVPAKGLSKAQTELLSDARDLVRYMEMLDAGVITLPFNPNASCVLKVKDGIRLVRLQTPTLQPLYDCTAEAQAIAGIAVPLASMEG